MKFGVRTPSLKRRIAARTSVKRRVRAKVRVPRGYGFVTNPKKAAYNRVYNRTSFSADKLLATSARRSSSSLKRETGHGWLWWAAIGWWYWALKLEIKAVIWAYNKFRKTANNERNPISSSDDLR